MQSLRTSTIQKTLDRDPNSDPSPVSTVGSFVKPNLQGLRTELEEVRCLRADPAKCGYQGSSTINSVAGTSVMTPLPSDSSSVEESSL